MGAVMSCIKGCFRAIGNGIMAVINGIAGILKGIINAIASFFSVIVGCLTCRRSGGGRSHKTHTKSHAGHGTRAHV